MTFHGYKGRFTAAAKGAESLLSWNRPWLEQALEHRVCTQPRRTLYKMTIWEACNREGSHAAAVKSRSLDHFKALPVQPGWLHRLKIR